MRKLDQIKTGIILSYGQVAASILVGILYIPIMIRLLGKSEYGLYSTVGSTISMLSLLSLGFNSSYIRYYAKYKESNATDKIASLNGLFLLVFIIISSVALVCGLYLTAHLEWVFSTGLSQQEYEIAKILMLLMSVNLSFTLLSSAFTSIVSAHQKFIFLKLLGIMKTVVSPILTLPLLLMGYGSIAMVSLTVLFSLIVDILTVWFVFKKLHQKFSFHNFEKGLLKSMMVYTSFIAINLFVDQLNTNIDKLLLGRFQGTGEVAVYSVGYTLFNYYMMFSTSISNVFTPKIHLIINNTRENLRLQKQQLTELFIKVGRIQFFVLGLILTGIIFFGREFILGFLAGPGYETSYIVTLLLVIPASIALIQNIGIEIQRALNLHKFRSIVYFFMAICNLFISIYLCQRYGAVGATAGTAFSLVLCNGIIMNVFYHKKCNINIIKFWESIGFEAKGLILPCILGFVIKRTKMVASVPTFIILVLMYIFVYVISMWYFGINSCEKEMVRTSFKKLRSTLKK